MKTIKYTKNNQNPESVLKNLIGEDLSKVTQIWYERFDYGTLITSRGEKIEGHSCTHLLVAKVGVNDYRYLASMSNGQCYKYYEYKGYPRSIHVKYKGKLIPEHGLNKSTRKYQGM